MFPKIITIERHILEQQRMHPEATGELTSLLYDLALAGKIIASQTTRAGISDILGATDSQNTYGETQQKLDVFADTIIRRMNDHTERLCAMASEEHENIIPIPPRYGTGKYVLLYDPLDGSSNIDVNVSVGTIFAIHRKRTDGEHGVVGDMLQPGRDLVAAGYMIYGSSTMMIYSTGQGVHGFTLDPSVGEFTLTHPDLRIPEPGKFYSCNQGYEKYWSTGVQKFTKWLQGLDESDPDAKAFGHRYVGSMVADFHRNLLQGGVFYYPADMRKPDQPAGKIRLLFEAQAMAFLAESAGGYGSDGVGNLLDLQPHELHQRVPVFIGNRHMVERAEALIREHDQAWIDRYMAYRSKTMETA
ncbi:MAG: class 1 fructose-bisphosphatase [Chloroflexi bacterium]|nr:class 1 fructose-bisphosphatase [Chloroflexota bacterium]